MKRIVILLLIPGLLNAAVSFNDAKLERAVLAELGRTGGTVSESELSGLIELNAAFHGITDLSGLEGAVSLRRLNLFGNAISDLTPLSGLAALEDLDLGANSITDIAPLGGLGSLTWLRLDLNPVADLSALSNLVELEHLSIDSIGAASLEALSSLSQLVYLSAANNAVTDATGLGLACPQLQEINLSGNRLISAVFIENLPDLVSIDLQDNFLGEIEWPGSPAIAAVDAGEWVHVALVIDGGTTIQPDSLKVYFEGGLIGSAAGSQLWSHGADIGIGGMNYQTRFPDIQPDGDGYYFDGQIDDVRIYHRSLDAAEIAALAAGAGPSDAAVWWPLDGDAQDSVGGNDGSTTGDAAFSSGLFGQALVLDGSGDIVTIPDSTDINLRNSPNYTVSLWFRADNPGGSRQILYEQGGRTRGLNLYVENGLFIAGAWNDIPEESAWEGAWLGEGALAGSLIRLNLSGNRIESLPAAPSEISPRDWDLSHNRLFTLDALAGASGPGTLRVEGNFFDPQSGSAVTSLESAGIGVFGRFPSSYLDYATWRDVWFTPAGAADELVSGPSADPDADGLVNLLECALGGDPLAPDAAAVAPRHGMSGTTFTYTFRDLCPGLHLNLLESSSLAPGSWTAAGGVLSFDALNENWRYEKTIADGGRGFVRLEVLLP